MNRYQFLSLTVIVFISGVSQGLLLPLLAVLLEQSGVSSVANGFNAAGLYAGILVTSFFIEKPVLRFGYRPVILFGLVLITLSTLLFPFFQNLWFWFLLRLLVGVGDSALHYSSQLWITSDAPAERRGRMISLYGLSYGMGFSAGPLGLNLLGLGIAAPFIVVSVFYIAAMIMIMGLPRRFPEKVQDTGTATPMTQRVSMIFRLAWFPLLTPLLYGYMEASLNGNFPVYALRSGITEGWVSIILPSFVAGSLILQLPLGILSDRIGRKKVLMYSASIGGLAFLLVPLVGNHITVIMVLFAIAGAFVGSFYSLGIAYTADILPKSYLPRANVMAAILYSVGSMIGPNLGGAAIQYVSGGMMFYLLGGVLFIFFFAGMIFIPGTVRHFHEKMES